MIKLNKRGSSLIATCIAVLAISMLMSMCLLISSIELRTLTVRNALKTGLANLAVTISDDTYAAIREGDFEEYARRLTSSDSYKRHLEALFINDVNGIIETDTTDYKVDNVILSFTRNGYKLGYTCSCDITFKVWLFGNEYPAVTKSVSVSGSHTAKYD